VGEWSVTDGVSKPANPQEILGILGDSPGNLGVLGAHAVVARGATRHRRVCCARTNAARSVWYHGKRNDPREEGPWAVPRRRSWGRTDAIVAGPLEMDQHDLGQGRRGAPAQAPQRVFRCTRKRIANGDLCQENTRSGGKSPGRRPSTLVPGPLPGVSQGRNGRTSRTDPKERTQDPCQGGVRLPFSAYYAYYAPSTAYYAPLRCVKRTPRGRSWGSFVSGRPRNPRTHARFRSTDPKTAFPTSRLHRGQHATRLSGVSHPPFFRGTT
jgi:hypothetical protein